MKPILQRIRKQIEKMSVSEIDDLLLIINAEFSRRISELYNKGNKLK